MKPIDARELPRSTRIETGVCIVGAGIAGIAIAREFIGAAQEVCLIESGGFTVDAETQSLCHMESIGYPVRQNFMARARYFGGTSNLWAGRSMRLDTIDFEKREWLAESGWPITFGEVEKYYPRAERVLDLPDVAQLDALAAGLAGGTNTPQPGPLLQGESGLEKKGKPADRALFKGGELRPKAVVWGRGPLRLKKAYRKVLEASPNIRILLHASGTEIVPNEAGTHVDSVHAATLNGNRLTIKARHYILACGGLENPRLLLSSRRRHAHGIGNAHDLVGRYFMEHPRAIFGRVRLTAPLGSSLLLGTPLSDGKLQIGVRLAEDVQRREQLLNSYLTLEPQMSELTQQAYQSSANVVKVLMRKGHAGSRLDLLRGNLPQVRDLVYLLTPKEVMPHFMYRGYARLKAYSHRFRKIQHLTLINFCEQVPRRDSRVFLGGIRDRLDMHSLVLDWKIGREETASLVRLQQLLGARLRKEGIGELEDADLKDVAPHYTDASHHMGTTRMSDDPRQGVVNRDARVHDIENLYIAGSSVFPTVGCANPTLTLVALALRLADRLKQAP